MRKTNVILVVFLIILLILVPNVVKAEGEGTEETPQIEVVRNIYSNDGSMRFEFKGLTLTEGHDYAYGFTKLATDEVTTWTDITVKTANSLTVDLSTGVPAIKAIMNSTDTGYITIKDKSAEETAEALVPACAVDLKMPYLRITNMNVINNGKEFTSAQANCIQVALRNDNNSIAKYQYEKVTDTALINKYKEIKAANGDYNGLESMIKSEVPTDGWLNWTYFEGNNADGINGYGYPTNKISAPEEGLYYMWVYFQGKSADLKPVYGVILVDNLAADPVAVTDITLTRTATVKLGETLTLIPGFTPEDATNKNVTWKSSDTSVATVDNEGKVTPVKVGTVDITVTSEDGNKTATCTVTVEEAKKDDKKPETPAPDKKDDTTIKGKLPQTGVSMIVVVAISVISVLAVIFYRKYKKYSL